MAVKLRVTKGGKPLLADTYEISDADSFGRAFSAVWATLRQKQFDGETSIGALMEHLDDDVLDQLDGAEIRLEKA